MIKETVLSRSLRRMFSGSLVLGFGVCNLAQAQDVPETPAASAAPEVAQVQRVEITGSSIKRIAKEGALPVQILTQDDIKKTGATSATDLIQMLPAMQGFVPASSSVNGGGAGVATAALHSLQSKYTLVLLDGQRMAPLALGTGQGGGFAVNIESIPLDAVERVEILTDGASALYGSDAIAGVVNFILKKNKTDANVYANYQMPQHAGGKSWSAGISKGFGDLDTDKFNVLFSYSHDEQSNLLAAQRSASARGAFFPFSHNGTNYVYDNRTGNTEPANITFKAAPAATPTLTSAYSINPFYSANGNCGSGLNGILLNPPGSSGASCRFNYAALVEDIPSSKRDSGLLKGTLKLNDDTSLWAELVLSRYAMTAQFAPSAQPLGLAAVQPAGANAAERFTPLYNKYVGAYLAQNNLVNPDGTATLGYRSVLLGGRADEYVTDAIHSAVGVNGLFQGWNYNATLTLSRSKINDNATGGYSDFNVFSGLVAGGTYDPVTGVGAASLRSGLLNGTNFSTTKSNLNTLHAGAQHDVLELPGGTSIISVGGDYSQTRYQIGYNPLLLSQSGFSTQPASANYPIGGSYGQVPFDASRDNFGLFGEWLLPVTKTLDATVSARYDSYSKTHSKYVFSDTVDPTSGLQQQQADADLGNKFSAGTYKLSLRWAPHDAVLIRGAYGTGFKAPNVNDIAGATTFNGSSQGSYACPFPGTSGCQGSTAQYDLLSGPNGASGTAGLQAEKSTQWTVGGRIEPTRGLSLGADLWSVKIKNQVLSAGIAEQVGFANPQLYSSLFVNPYQDPAGFTTIAYKTAPINGGVANYKGVDWDFSYRSGSPVGDWSALWNGTYMIKQNYTVVPGGVVLSDLGKFGPDNAVVFRVQMHLALALKSGPFTNTVTGNYKSGYKDQTYAAGTAVYLANSDGSRGANVAFDGLEVPSYVTFDWQGKYDYTKTMVLTAGIKNIFAKSPPLTLQNAGGGNQVGYDGRYADPLGRTFYLTGNYRF